MTRVYNRILRALPSARSRGEPLFRGSGDKAPFLSPEAESLLNFRSQKGGA